MFAGSALAVAAGNQFVAVAYSPVYETWGYGKSTNKETAVANAMFNCNYTGGFCGLAAVSPKRGCVVPSTRGIGEEYVGGSGSTLPEAMSDAQRKLHGRQVKNYMCS
jgi:hypothetical protein